MENESEEYCVVCRICWKEGPWQTDDSIPLGFIEDKEKGLVCLECCEKD